jgi:hypothetical protein
LSAAPPRRASVTFAPFSASTTAGLTLLLFAWFVAVEASAVVAASHVDITCDRTAGACVVASTLAIVDVELSAERIPIASIRSTHLDETRSRHSTTYTLVVVTDSGEVHVSHRSAGHASRAEAERELDAFLADPSARSLHVDYDEPTAVAAVFALWGVLLAFVAFFVFRVTRVEIDRAAGTVAIVQTRWPFAATRRELPLASVRDAVVLESVKDKQGRQTYIPALVVDDEADALRLAERGSTQRARLDRATATLRARLLEAKSDRG